MPSHAGWALPFPPSSLPFLLPCRSSNASPHTTSSCWGCRASSAAHTGSCRYENLSIHTCVQRASLSKTSKEVNLSWGPMSLVPEPHPEWCSPLLLRVFDGTISRCTGVPHNNELPLPRSSPLLPHTSTSSPPSSADPGGQPHAHVSPGLWLVAHHGAAVRGGADLHPRRLLVRGHLA